MSSGKRRAVSKPNKGNPEPKRLILEAAEVVFAGRGFDPATLREITEQAGVNIAAVNYYFDSKTDLIQEVLDRMLTPFVQARHERLVELRERQRAGEAVCLQDVVMALVRPMVELSRDSRGGRTIIRFLMQVRAQPIAETLQVFVHRVDPVAEEFIEAVLACGIKITREEAFWRYNFAIGSVMHVLTDADHATRRLQVMSGGLCDTDDDEAIIDNLVRFITAGFREGEPEPAKPLDAAHDK